MAQIVFESSGPASRHDSVLYDSSQEWQENDRSIASMKVFHAP